MPINPTKILSFSCFIFLVIINYLICLYTCLSAPSRENFACFYQHETQVSGTMSNTYEVLENICRINNYFGSLEASKHLGLWNRKQQLSTLTPCPLQSSLGNAPPLKLKPMEITLLSPSFLGIFSTALFPTAPDFLIVTQMSHQCYLRLYLNSFCS